MLLRPEAESFAWGKKESEFDFYHNRPSRHRGGSVVWPWSCHRMKGDGYGLGFMVEPYGVQKRSFLGTCDDPPIVNYLGVPKTLCIGG